MTSTIQQEIAKRLERLPLEQQQRVLHFAEALVLSAPKGVSGARFLQSSGTLNAEDVQAMAQAIEEGCERVDSHEW
ncbi:MAG: DUF2281 domain-containing protein [Armatimonadota bacterium]|nr:DUF2281 domain-containing protein [Armatimonadota bacterium]